MPPGSKWVTAVLQTKPRSGLDHCDPSPRERRRLSGTSSVTITGTSGTLSSTAAITDCQYPQATTNTSASPKQSQHGPGNERQQAPSWSLSQSGFNGKSPQLVSIRFDAWRYGVVQSQQHSGSLQHIYASSQQQAANRKTVKVTVGGFGRIWRVVAYKPPSVSQVTPPPELHAFSASPNRLTMTQGASRQEHHHRHSAERFNGSVSLSESGLARWRDGVVQPQQHGEHEPLTLAASPMEATERSP